MTIASQDCARCGGRLERGYIRDLADKRTERSRWVEGAPEKSFWGGVQTRHRRLLEIRADRCTRCGRLELYAESTGD